MESQENILNGVAMSVTISANTELNKQFPDLDDCRRRLGLSSLHGKIKSSLLLLNYANKVCDEAILSYEDANKSEAHLASCIEGVFTALAEVVDNSKTGLVLCQKVIGDKSVPPLERFTAAMKSENGIP